MRNPYEIPWPIKACLVALLLSTFMLAWQVGRLSGAVEAMQILQTSNCKEATFQ